MNIFNLAILHLKRKPFQSLLIIFFISTAIASSGIFYRLNKLSSLRLSNIATQGDILVSPKSNEIISLLNIFNSEGEYPNYIPYELFNSLENQKIVNPLTPKIKEVTGYLFFAKYKKYQVMGVSDNLLNRKTQEGEVILGYAVARTENLSIGDSLESKLWINSKNSNSLPSVTLRVAGIEAQKNNNWDYLIYSNISTAQNQLRLYSYLLDSTWGAAVLNYFTVNLDIGQYSKMISLINDRTIAQAIVIDDSVELLKSITNTNSNFSKFSSFIIIFLSFIAISSTLFTRYESMQLQLNVLRAIGLKKVQMMGMLIFEGLILAISACALGAIVDFLLFPIINDYLGQSSQHISLVSPKIIWSSPIWIFAILATTISAVLPILKLYRKDIHSSLRD